MGDFGPGQRQPTSSRHATFGEVRAQQDLLGGRHSIQHPTHALHGGVEGGVGLVLHLPDERHVGEDPFLRQVVGDEAEIGTTVQRSLHGVEDRPVVGAVAHQRDDHHPLACERGELGDGRAQVRGKQRARGENHVVRANAGGLPVVLPSREDWLDVGEAELAAALLEQLQHLIRDVQGGDRSNPRRQWDGQGPCPTADVEYGPVRR